MTFFKRNPFVVPFVLLHLAGCSGNRIASQVAAMNDANIKRLVNLYTAYQSVHGWQGPKDENVLKSFVTSRGIPERNLEMMGIDPNIVDNVFKSDRDGKPFKVRYGVTGGRGVSDAIVFEDQGINGKKMVAFNGPLVEEVDDAEYKKLWEYGGRPEGMTGQSVGPPASNGGKRPN